MNDENINRSAPDILVVDDVSENLKLLLNMLAPAGYKVQPTNHLYH
jgi:CheY-like chemotaxis protein